MCGYQNWAGSISQKICASPGKSRELVYWWFISVNVEVRDEVPQKRPSAVGVDVGLNQLATLSTGEEFENQAFLTTTLKKLRQANKRLHHRKPGSKNREKARSQVARFYYRITCMRDDVLHKLTTRLADCYGIIGIEDLHLKGLLKHRSLARSFSDAALGKLLVGEETLSPSSDFSARLCI